MGAVREMVIPGEEGEVLAVGCMAEEVELMEVEVGPMAVGLAGTWSTVTGEATSSS